MFLLIAVLIAVVLFGIQLALCFGKLRRAYKWFPVVLLAVLETACIGLICFDAHFGMVLPYGAAFAAYIYAVMGVCWAAGLLLAWLVYAVVKAAQNRRK